MNLLRYIFTVILLVSFLMLVSCGNIDGQYLQLDSPFENSSINNSTQSDSSSGDTSSSESNVDVSFTFKNDELVRVSDFIPDAVIDIKYSTTDNFTGGKIYNFNDAYLRYGTVLKLKKACDTLRSQGFRLLIWDAFRPQSAQYTLCENASEADREFLSNPDKKSQHSAGRTIDVSMVKMDGSSVEMPTAQTI
ncbi:MAG: D-alanyl-D-alanine carboxypeptidase family protein, partial [Clostridia bacterium]|nr:D-alanyl-D-alanine carboxypeptidase family protein [Clostridia bacterium]